MTEQIDLEKIPDLVKRLPGWDIVPICIAMSYLLGVKDGRIDGLKEAFKIAAKEEDWK